MKKHILLVLLSLLLGSQVAVAQDHVTNIRAVQNDKMVTITYDLNVRSDVRLFISIDDGQTYTDTMKVTGYVNRVVPQGKNRTIRWQAFNDLGYGDYPEIRFKFVTKEAQTQAPMVKRTPKITFITLNGGYTNTENPSVGFTFGQVQKFGWFASVMSGFNFAGLAPAAVSDADGFVGEDLPFYKDEYAKTVLSVMGGGVIRLNDMMYLKAGLGFGNRSLSWKTLDDRWVRNGGYSAVGVDVSAGMMFNFGGFVLSLDAVTTNFSIFEGRVGLGYSFENR
ncbi:MAG: hypothetical protein IKX35_08035 [Bacteroidales bacterium]|nr:hypothetical protein [Bacteroidales bacterium]